jgi:hypothetical protein
MLYPFRPDVRPVFFWCLIVPGYACKGMRPDLRPRNFLRLQALPLLAQNPAHIEKPTLAIGDFF